MRYFEKVMRTKNGDAAKCYCRWGQRRREAARVPTNALRQDRSSFSFSMSRCSFSVTIHPEPELQAPRIRESDSGGPSRARDPSACVPYLARALLIHGSKSLGQAQAGPERRLSRRATKMAEING